MYIATRHNASVEPDWDNWNPWDPSTGMKWIIETGYSDEHVESIVESLAEMGFAVLDAGRVVVVGA